MVAVWDYALLLFAGGMEAAAAPTEEALRLEDGPLVQLARQVEAAVEAPSVLFASLSLNVLLLLLFCAMVRRRPPKAAALPGSRNALDAAESQRRARKAERVKKASKPVIGSLVGAVADLKRLHEDYKFLAAGELLDALRVALMNASGGGWGSWGAVDAQRQLDSLLSDGVLEDRISTARGAVRDLSSNDGFELVQQDASMKVLQRFTPSRHLTVKIEAVLDGVSASDCLMIWREATLYPEWCPFITGGKTLGEVHPGEAVIQLMVETYFMAVDMVLWGWACDNIDESGEVLMCVRPITSSTKLPDGVKYPKLDAGKSTILGTLRAKAVIDILVEPLSDSSVRFAFQMSDQIADVVPSWGVNYVVQNAMVNVFERMRIAASGMGRCDPSSKHYRFVNRPEYAPTKKWIESRIH